jgi:hypothetical protein
MRGQTKGRVCVICKKPGGDAYTLLLKWLKIEGNYAHAKCLQRANRKSWAATGERPRTKGER